MKTEAYIIFILIVILFSCGCATIPEKTGQHAEYAVSDISEGLPRGALWRQDVALAYLDDGGFLDIVVPSPRKPEREEETRPHVFVFDRQGKKWKESAFSFPDPAAYGYGGVAVGDLNRDGYADVVFAVHSKKLVILQNDGAKGFKSIPFPETGSFRSRAVQIADLNGDGWPDVIALSELYEETRGNTGILLGMNIGGKSWDVKKVEGSSDVTGDSIAVGDLKGDGNKDLIAAHMTMDIEKQRLVWFGDGKGGFKTYESNFVGEMMPRMVKAGDVDGAGRDEIIFKLTDLKRGGKILLAVYKWTGERFEDMSSGLEAVDKPIVFDLVDMDGDGKRKDLIVLSERGLGIYRYDAAGKKWLEKAGYPLDPADTMGSFGLAAGRNPDGSVLVVYNLGSASATLHRGLRAFLVKH